MTSRTVTGGAGVGLRVAEAGKFDGRPILFIHGTSQSHLCWSKQIESDLARDFRLVAMDLRGHGGSEKPRDAYGDSALWAEDVHAVITELELERPVLCGWSYGGIVIGDYVERYGEGAVGGSVWVGAISRLGEPLLGDGLLYDDFLAIVPGLFSEDVGVGVGALEEFVRFLVHGEMSEADFYLFLGWNAAVPPHVRLGLFARELNHDPVIEGMTTPILVVHGEEDRIVKLSSSERIAGLTEHARLSVHPEAGHAVFWDQPERFNAELRAFVEGV